MLVQPIVQPLSVEFDIHPQHLAPLVGAEACAGRVMAAAVEEEDIARACTGEVGQHRFEIDARRLLVVEAVDADAPP